MAIDVLKQKRGQVYRARVVLPSGKRVSKCFTRKVDAIQYEATALSQPKQFEQREDKKILFSAFTDLYFENHCSALEFTTREKYESALRLHIKPYFERRLLDSISNLDVAEYAAHLKKSALGDAMKAFLFTTFKSILKKGFEWGFLDRIPGAGTRAPRRAKHRIEFWTARETESFLAAMRSSPRLPLYLVALNTGMRAGEILGLKWDAIDFDRRMIVVKRSYCQKQRLIKEATKTHKERFIGMNDVVYAALLELRRRSETDELFTPECLGCIDITHVSRTLRADCRRAGVRAIRFHDLRHTFATQFVTNGGSIFHLSGILGHSTTAMTSRYAHYCMNQAREVASVVSFGAPIEDNVVQFRNGQKVVTKTT